jgi:hypothetical protein
MLSAPAAMPATIVATLPPGFVPVEIPRSTRWSTSPVRSAFSASRITGTSPAHDTRFGSSKTALTPRLCDNRT